MIYAAWKIEVIAYRSKKGHQIILLFRHLQSINKIIRCMRLISNVLLLFTHLIDEWHLIYKKKHDLFTFYFFPIHKFYPTTYEHKYCTTKIPPQK